jgi:phosphoribosylformimino-5-aminoimidazole carboxamide ribotide isomerase
MRVIPAIDIKDGKCVQLVGGKPGTEQVSIEDVLGVAKRWEAEGAEMLHMIDLDSALGTGSNDRLIEKVAASIDIPVQVGGGVRTEEHISRLFEIGCERVIIGTRAIQDRAFVQTISEQYRDGIVVAVDSMAQDIMIKGWQEKSGKDLMSVIEDLQSLPIYGFLYTNVEVEGQLRGIDPVPIKAILGASTKPVIISGGITSTTDLETLKTMGVDSVVIGMAIYTGRIDFRKAVRLFR